MRVVSLLPSATEIVCAIGAHDMLVGRSHECDYPAKIDHLPALTRQKSSGSDPAAIDAQVREALQQGTSLYELDTQKLTELAPDLIITQDLCNVCSIDLNTVRRTAESMHSRPDVLSLNPTTIEGVLDDVLQVGEATERIVAAERLIVELRARMYAASDFVNPFDDGPITVFLEWTDPLYVGGDWIPQLIERAGGRHPLNPTEPVEEAGAAAGPVGVTHRRAGRSRRISPEDLVACGAERIVVCPCGVQLEDAIEQARSLQRADWWGHIASGLQRPIAVVDGNQMFSRPGPRLVDAFEWLVGWLNDRPELIPSDFPWLGEWPRGN